MPNKCSYTELFEDALPDCAGLASNYTGGFYEGYNEAYQNAIKSGSSQFSAELQALESAIYSNYEYAIKNAQQAADSSWRQVHESLAAYYKNIGDSLTSQSIATRAELDVFLEDLRGQAAAGLGRWVTP